MTTAQADPSSVGGIGAPEPEISNRKKLAAERRAQLLRSPGFVFGIIIVGFWLICGLFPGLITSRDPRTAVRIDDSVIARASPRADAWFGTDAIGNDVFSRVIFGARSVLVTAPVAAVLAIVLGTILGLMMGYYRGWFDEIWSRVVEAVLSLPVILLALMAVTVFGSSRVVTILTVAGLFTPVVARTVRSAVLVEAQLDYVASAKLRGESGLYIMVREILPNIIGVIVVEFTVRVGYAIFTIATLAFLGLGNPDATVPDWGQDISAGYTLIQAKQWWITIFPALAIALLVIGINLIADNIEKAYKE